MPNWWFTARIRTPEGDDQFLEMQAENKDHVKDFLKYTLAPTFKLLEIRQEGEME